MTSNVDVTNRALAYAGTRSQIAAMNENSQEAQYANLLYIPLRDFMLREGDYDFSLKPVPTVVAAAPPVPWTYAYTYPSDCIRVRSLVPSVYEPLDPVPVEFNVIEVTNTRFVVTRVAAAQMIYTYAPPEDNWDPIFMEAFTRLLASSLLFALENRIEASNKAMNEALQFAGIGAMRDE